MTESINEKGPNEELEQEFLPEENPNKMFSVVFPYQIRFIIPDNDDAGRAMKDAIIEGARGKETYVAECPEGFKDAADLNSDQINTIIENRKNSIFN